MERGFDETGMCSAGRRILASDSARRVAACGRENVAELDPVVAAFHGRRCVRTIVWLAKTNASEYHDPKKYQQMQNRRGQRR